MATDELPKSVAELSALYNKLKASGPRQSDRVTNEEFYAQYVLHFGASVPVLYNKVQLGTAGLKGERLPHMRPVVSEQLDALCKRYEHVLAPKATQSVADVRRGNRDADVALLRLQLLMSQAVPWLKLSLALDQLPVPDDTFVERLSLVLCALVQCVSPPRGRRLIRWFGLLERTTLKFLTSREACRMLVGVLRLELVGKLQTFGELCEEYSHGSQPLHRPPPAKHQSGDVHVSHWYLETLKRVTNPNLMLA